MPRKGFACCPGLARVLGWRSRHLKKRHVDPRRTTPRHALYLRSPDWTRPPRCPLAARTILPHPDPQLFAEDPARRAFHQLAAGSAVQLSRAVGLPREDW